MISEVVNSLFVTYVASEYLLSVDQTGPGRRNEALKPNRAKLYIAVASGALVLMVNLLDHVSGTKEILNQTLEGFFHLPKAIFAAIVYFLTLYWDIKRRVPQLDYLRFRSRVCWAFAKILPAYPFLAVLISFIFLFVINLWEALHLPMELLNAPIYYGTLYGPFAWVYVHVKREVLSEASSLPMAQFT